MILGLLKKSEKDSNKKGFLSRLKPKKRLKRILIAGLVCLLALILAVVLFVINILETVSTTTAVLTNALSLGLFEDVEGGSEAVDVRIPTLSEFPIAGGGTLEYKEYPFKENEAPNLIALTNEYDKNVYRHIMLCYEAVAELGGSLSAEVLMGIPALETGGTYFKGLPSDPDAYKHGTDTKGNILTDVAALYRNSYDYCGIYQMDLSLTDTWSKYTATNTDLLVSEGYMTATYVPNAVYSTAKRLSTMHVRQFPQTTVEVTNQAVTGYHFYGAFIPEILSAYGVKDSSEVRTQIYGALDYSVVHGSFSDVAWRKAVIEVVVAIIASADGNIYNFELHGINDNLGQAGKALVFGSAYNGGSGSSPYSLPSGIQGYATLKGKKLSGSVIQEVVRLQGAEHPELLEALDLYNVKLSSGNPWAYNMYGGVATMLIGRFRINDTLKKVGAYDGGTGGGTSGGTPSLEGVRLHSPVKPVFTSDLKYDTQGGHIYMTSLYGYRDLYGNGKIAFHNGVDFGGQGHTDIPILAVAGGTVVRVTNSKASTGFGTCVIVKHMDGVYTVYAHLAYNSPSVKAGDPVSAGQQLGIMGTTGNSTGVHLHLGVCTKLNGTLVDSTSYTDPFPMFLSRLGLKETTYTAQKPKNVLE